MMKDSKVSPQWLAACIAANPVRALGNGNFTTGPVRLAHANILEPQVNKLRPNDDPKFGTAILWPLGVDLTLLANEVNRLVDAKWPGSPRDPQGRPYGIHTPFRDQAERIGKEGFTPGAIFTNISSKFKPAVVDVAMNPIIDKGRVYSGAWAICAINLYDFAQPQKKGISFGLQSVMIIQDDQKLGGAGGSDPAKDFAGVQVTADTSFSGQFGVMPGAPAAAPVQPFVPPADVNAADLY